MPHCKPGDMAIVVRADLAYNLGTIVKIVRAHDGSGDLYFTGKGVWWVTSPKRMKYEQAGKIFWRKQGPVPDNRLQPIQEPPTDQRAAEREVKQLMRKLKKGIAKKREKEVVTCR